MDFNRMLSSHAKHFHAPVLRFADRDLSMTCRDLLDWSGSYCGLYLANHITPGSRIGLWMGNVPEYALAYTAALRMGAVTVPLSVYEAFGKAASAADGCGCGLLLYDSRNRHVRAQLEKAGPLPGHWLDVAAFPSGGGVLLPPYSAGETCAYDWDMQEEYCILHSSGSTGARKAIRKTVASTLGNRHVVRGLRLMIRALRAITPLDLCNVCPWYHNTGNLMLLLTLCGGRYKQIVTEYFNPVHTARYLERERPVIWLGTATMLYRVCCADPARETVFPSIIFSSGEVLSDHVLRTLSAQRGCRLLLSFYGTTELGILSTLQYAFGNPPLRYRLILFLLRCFDLGGPPDAAVERRPFSSCLGLISKSVDVRVCGADGRVLPDGEEGEIFAKKRKVQGVYLDRTQPEDYISTGDLGYKLGRQLYLLGRKKELIIRSGEKIIPSEIEELLLACPGVADAVVCAVPSPDHGEDVCACLQPGDPPPDLEAVRARLRDCLPCFMQPQHYLLRDSFPCNASGKTDRKRVAAEAKAALGL